MARNELLEESEYSDVGASLAVGPDEDSRHTSGTGLYGWTHPIAKDPLASRDICHGVRLEVYRSIAVIPERQGHASRRYER